MLAESAKNLVPKFFDETGTTYDGVVSYGTLGKDKYWTVSYTHLTLPTSDLV